MHFEEHGFWFLLEKSMEEELTCTAEPSQSRFETPVAPDCTPDPLNGCTLDRCNGLPSRQCVSAVVALRPQCVNAGDFLLSQLQNLKPMIRVAFTVPLTARRATLGATNSHARPWRKASHDGVLASDGSWQVSGT